MEVLYHDDDDQVEYASSVNQFSRYLSVDNGARHVPIEFDQINFIDCGKVDSSPVILDISSSGFLYPDGHLVYAKDIISGDDADDTQILYHEDPDTVHEHSSIDQFSTFLHTKVGGVSVPIEFDQIDYIDCGHVVSHPMIVDSGENVGYIFEDGEFVQTETSYPTFHREETVLKELQPEFGDGFYEDYEEYEAITNFDDGTALGTQNKDKLRVGQHYYLADEFLPSDDPEE